MAEKVEVTDEQPTGKQLEPGEQVDVLGVSGKVEVHRWHVGDDFRIIVYGRENSVYFIANKEVVEKLVDAIDNPGVEGETNSVSTGGRAAITVTQIGDRIVLEAYDHFMPQYKVQAILNPSQVKHFISLF